MAPERTSSGFGARLRDARERRGVSLRQIASATKISVAVLDALERNDISKLPGGIFGRAFIRSYAMEVGLDPEATIQDFMKEFPNDTAITGRPSSDHVETNVVDENERRSAGAFVWLLALAVPIAAGMLYVGTLNRSVTEDPPAPPEMTPAPIARESDASAVTTPIPATPSALPAPASAATSGDQLTITLTATRPCWVSATVDGQKSIERLLPVGEERVITVRREMVLTVGDASAIALRFNGADARALGKAGEVVTARFNLTNYKDYLQGR